MNFETLGGKSRHSKVFNISRTLDSEFYKKVMGFWIGCLNLKNVIMGLMNKKVIKCLKSQRHKLLDKKKLKVTMYNTGMVK